MSLLLSEVIIVVKNIQTWHEFIVMQKKNKNNNNITLQKMKIVERQDVFFFIAIFKVIRSVWPKCATAIPMGAHTSKSVKNVQNSNLCWQTSSACFFSYQGLGFGLSHVPRWAAVYMENAKCIWADLVFGICYIEWMWGSEREREQKMRTIKALCVFMAQ